MGSPFTNIDGCKTDVLQIINGAINDDTKRCFAFAMTRISFFLAITGLFEDCDTPSSYLCKFSYNKNSIIFVSTDSGLDWYQAEQQCQMKGGHLASIHDSTEKSIFNCLLTQKLVSFVCLVSVLVSALRALFCNIFADSRIELP